MPVASDTFTYWRSRLALLTKHGAPVQEIDEARCNMLAARLGDQIRATLTLAPGLPLAKRQELADLFRVGDPR